MKLKRSRLNLTCLVLKMSGRRAEMKLVRKVIPVLLVIVTAAITSKVRGVSK